MSRRSLDIEALDSLTCCLISVKLQSELNVISLKKLSCSCLVLAQYFSSCVWFA